MKKILIVLLIFSAYLVKAQEKQSDDLQKVKDALVNSVIQCQALQKQNDNLNATIKNVADDLKKIKTVEQLDSLKVVYGLAPKKLKQ